MNEKLKNFGEALKSLPQDCWAVLLLTIGMVLTISNHKDEGMLVIGASLAVFKSQASAQ